MPYLLPCKQASPPPPRHEGFRACAPQPPSHALRVVAALTLRPARLCACFPTPAPLLGTLGCDTQAYLGEGMGPLSWLADLHIPHPGRVAGQHILKVGRLAVRPQCKYAAAGAQARCALHCQPMESPPDLFLDASQGCPQSRCHAMCACLRAGYNARRAPLGAGRQHKQADPHARASMQAIRLPAVFSGARACLCTRTSACVF